MTFFGERIVKKIVSNRKVVIWSACSKSDFAYHLCKELGLELIGYVDRDAEEIRNFHGVPVYSHNEIEQLKDCFFFVALDCYYESVLNALNNLGLQQYVDYIYPYLADFEIERTTLEHTYIGCNEISGIIDGFHVEMHGRFSKLAIGKNCKIHSSVKFRIGSASTICIGDNVVIKENCFISADGGELVIGDGCCIGEESKCFAWQESRIFIGSNTTVSGRLMLSASQKSYCEIGHDCMLSDGIGIKTVDSHNYFDLTTGENINWKKEHSVILGNHIWVGREAKIFGGGQYWGWKYCRMEFIC